MPIIGVSKEIAMGKKMLVADDEQMVRDLLVDHFSQLDFQVSTAATGQEAVDKAKKEKPDIILLDIKMPQMSGLEALKAIRDLGLKMKIIMVTGHVEKGIIEEIMALGADHYIKKPLALSYLEGQVRDILES
jgi:CheY-like chemotaxis protein